MKILNVSQANETDEWLEARKGKITGSAGEGQLISKLGVPFWQMLAERIAEPSDGENAAERGHRLENINAQMTVEAHGLKNPLYDTKLWVSDEDDNIAVSPDCHEDVPEPTWAIECKSLSSAKHLSIVVPMVLGGEQWHVMTGAKVKTGIQLLPLQYQFQAIQYFVVDEKLKHLYFSFYDPRITLEKYQRVDLDITREMLGETLHERLETEEETTGLINSIIELGGDSETGF